MNQPVEDTIRQRGITDLFMPARHGKLRSKDRRAHLVAALANLPEVAPLIASICKSGKPASRDIVVAAWLRLFTARHRNYSP